jgi:replication factor A1
MNIGADIPEAHNLKGWYDGEGKDASFSGVGGGGGGGAGSRNMVFKREEMKTLQDIRGGTIGTRDTPDYFNTRASVITIRNETLAYSACKNCNKKTTLSGSVWHCDKCDQSGNEPNYR